MVMVSGPEAIEVVSRIFKGSGGREVRGIPSGRLLYGSIIDDVTATPVDEAIVGVWRRNDSFTGEDLVEVNCHGGPRAVRKTLEAVIKAGAKESCWREFLKRGLRNSRLDFVQIEAQEALIRAKTRFSAKVLLAQHQGLLTESVARLEGEIGTIIETKDSTDRGSSDKLTQLLKGLDKLLATSAFGLAITTPKKVSIAGLPNVGKSTLFNALLGKERAIVHHAPGTTRDCINEYFSALGIPLELVDSAGLREAEEQVERTGVNAARALHKQADRVIFLLDASREISEKELALIKTIGPKKVILAINKIDLGVVLDTSMLEDQFNAPTCHISALKGMGLDKLKEALVIEHTPYIDSYEVKGCPCAVIFTERQKSVLYQALELTKGALKTLTETGTHDTMALNAVRDKLVELRRGPKHGNRESEKVCQHDASPMLTDPCELQGSMSGKI